jgi:hypothetical protein
MVLDGMVHARVVRQPCRGVTIKAIDEAAIRHSAKGQIEIIRDGNSSPSSDPTRPLSRPLRRRRRQTTSNGTGSMLSPRFRKRRGVCCSNPRSTASLGPLHRRAALPGKSPRAPLHLNAGLARSRKDRFDRRSQDMALRFFDRCWPLL